MNENLASKLIILVALSFQLFIGCQSAPEAVREPQFTGGTAPYGVLNLARCYQLASNPQLQELEAAQQKWYAALPVETLALVRKRCTVQEQIEALPMDSVLRMDKVRQLLRVTNELAHDEQWAVYQTSRRLGLESIATNIQNCLNRCSIAKSIAFVIVFNRPEPDDTGEQLFKNSIASAKFAPLPDLYDLTDDVLSLLKRRDTEPTLDLGSIGLPIVVEQPEVFSPKEPDRGLYVSPIK